jgi:hypothetical protein
LVSTWEALDGHKASIGNGTNEAPPSQYGRPEAARSDTCIARGCSADAAIELPDYQPAHPRWALGISMIAPEYTRTNKFMNPRRQAFTN